MKRKLICFIAHAPHFESCLPILAAVHNRGNVEVVPIVNKRFKKTEKNLLTSFENIGLKPNFKSRLYIELLSFIAMRDADAILTYGDPLALSNTIRPRDRYLVSSGIPSIFIQHGLFQYGVNYDADFIQKNWYATRILWWEEYEPIKAPFITAEVANRIRKVGFIKKNFQNPHTFSPSLMDFIHSFNRRLLICTTFDHENRFNKENLIKTYNMFEQFCIKNPDVLLLLRPHRGKHKSRSKEFDEALNNKYKNVILMDRYSGEFSYCNIHDCLAISDMMIAHAGSAALDGVYSNLPTAVLFNDYESLNGLPEISSLKNLTQFCETAGSYDVLNNETRKIFGELNENIDRAAAYIEEIMLQ